MIFVAVVLTMFLAACAYIAGPCSLSGADKSAACEVGGRLILVPSKVLETIEHSTDPQRYYPNPELVHPHEHGRRGQ